MATEQDIDAKLNQQTKLLQEICEQNKKTQKELLWLRVLGLIKIAIIAAPIILGIIYLPPFVQKIIDEYKEIVPGLEKIEQFIEQNQLNAPK